MCKSELTKEQKLIVRQMLEDIVEERELWPILADYLVDLDVNIRSRNHVEVCQVALCSIATKRCICEIDNTTYATGYAELGYPEEQLVAFANWNTQGDDDAPELWLKLLESFGFECQWSDEWTTCGDCGLAIRTQPDSMWWEPSYRLVSDCEIVCLKCYNDNHVVVEEEEEEVEENDSEGLTI